MARKPPVLLAVLALACAPAAAPAPAAGMLPATLSLSGFDPTDHEGGRVRLEVVRSGDATTEAAADMVVISGGPEDVATTPVHVVLPPGQRRVPVTVQLVDDDVVEPAKTVSFALANPAPGTSLGGEPYSVTVHDDDFDLVTHDVTVTEGGTAVLELRRLDPVLEVPGVGVTERGRSTGRFAYPSGVLFPAGAESATIEIGVRQDTVHEPTTSTDFVVANRRLELGAAREVQRGVARITVVDDDPADLAAPRVTLAAAGMRLPRPVVTLRCDEACAGSAELRLPGHGLVARAKLELGAGELRTVALRVTRRGRAVLRRVRRTTAIVRVSVADAAGNRRTVTRRFSLMR